MLLHPRRFIAAPPPLLRAKLGRLVSERVTDQATLRAKELSELERDVLRLITRAWATQDMAAELGVPARRTRAALVRLQLATGHRTRTGLPIWAYEEGLID